MFITLFRMHTRMLQKYNIMIGLPRSKKVYHEGPASLSVLNNMLLNLDKHFLSKRYIPKNIH